MGSCHLEESLCYQLHPLSREALWANSGISAFRAVRRFPADLDAARQQFSTNKSHFSCTWGRGFTASLLLQEPGRAGAHSLWVAFPQPPETPWVVRLQLTSELYRELSQDRNNQVISFLPLFPGLFLTQMSSPDWHNERGDGGKRWHGLRLYQEKKCWRITSLNHSLTSCLKSCWFFSLDLQNMAAGSKNSECLQTPNSISLLDFWLCSVLFLDFFLFFLPTSLPFPSSEIV